MARCKVKCRSKTDFADGFSNINFEVVREGSEDNKKFFVGSPSGSFGLLNVAPDIANQIQVGEEYFVDITPVK